MGYYQIKLEEESSYLRTFNTSFGRFRYLRVPIRAKGSGDGDMDGVEIVVDDILVHGKTLEEHNMSLKNVLAKAREINLKLNKEKQKRLMACRQFVNWVRRGQPLGRKFRTALPSCVVDKKRKAFADPVGQYEGFRSASSEESESD